MIDLGTLNFEVIAGPLGGEPPNNNVGIFAFAYDDNSIVWFADNGSGTQDPYGLKWNFSVFVIDVSGALTWYAAYAYVPGVGGAISSIIPLGTGNFLVTLSTGSVYHVRVANQKLNNVTPILLYPVFPFTNSCTGGAIHSIYYDALNKLIAVSWYVAAGQLGTDIYSSIYRIDDNGNIAQVVTGYSGYSCPDCSPPVPDSYDLVTSNTGGATKYGLQSNGVSAALYGNNPPHYIGRQTFKVTVGSNKGDCITPNGNSVANGANSEFYIPDPSNDFGSFTLLDSNIFGLTGCMTQYNQVPATVLGTGWLVGDNSLIFTFGVGLNRPNTWGGGQLVVTKKNVFCVAQAASPSVEGLITVASANDVFFNGAVTYRKSFGLVNGTRPISITGRYKA